MRIAITGAGGQLASALVRRLAGYEVVPLAKAVCDIRRPAAVRECLSRIQPALVINAAAYTRVDECENHGDHAFAVNAYGAQNVARVCEDLGAVLAHVSTDYVFGGDKQAPYLEDDTPDPINAYGASKLAGERFVRAACRRHFIVRTSGLYGRGDGRPVTNFVDTMLSLVRGGKTIRVVYDQIVAPTYTSDLAEAIRQIIETTAYGVFHITNSGQCSWYEFARHIFACCGIEKDCWPITSSEFGARAGRPRCSVLGSKRLSSIGVRPLRHWKDAVAVYLDSDAPAAAGVSTRSLT